MSSEAGNELKDYLEMAKELGEINYEIVMVNKLVEKAQEELDYRTLNALRQYMSVLLQKLGELQAKKVQLEQKLEKLKPPFIKAIDRAEYQTKQIMSLVRDVIAGRLNLGELWNEISASRNYIPKLLQDLEKAKSKIKELVEKNPSLAEYLRIELNRIEKSVRVLNIVAQIVMLEPSQIIRYKKMIGTSVIIEPDEKTGVVSDIFVDAAGKIYIEISEELPADAALIEALFRDIGFDFGASDINDFRTKLIRRMESRLGKRDLKPSIIKHFLSIEGLIQYLSAETRARLEPQYQVLGFVLIDNVENLGGELRVNRQHIITKPDSLIKCPSIRILPERALEKTVRLKGKYYKILLQTFLPMIGRVAIVMQQDKNGEPLPDRKLLEKLFYYIAQKQDLSAEQKGWVAKAIKYLRSGKKIEEVYWMLRVIITRSGLKVKDELSESNALRPAYVFLYALKNGIPLTYSEILSHYLYYINTDYLEYAGRQLQVKIPISPRPLAEGLKPNHLRMLVGFACQDFLGVQVDKGRLIMLCAPKLDSETLERIKDTYKIQLNKNLTAGKIIKMLIYYSKIKTSSEYRSLLDMLGVRRIIYNELVKEFEENDELVIAHAFLINLMRRGAGG